jgi:hypothetical protein
MWLWIAAFVLVVYPLFIWLILRVLGEGDREDERRIQALDAVRERAEAPYSGASTASGRG